MHTRLILILLYFVHLVLSQEQEADSKLGYGNIYLKPEKSQSLKVSLKALQ